MRRLVAATAIIAGLAWLAGLTIADRDVARHTQAIAAGANRQAAVRISGGESLFGVNDGEAAAALAAIVADRGSATGVRVSIRPLSATVPVGFTAVDIEALAPEAALRALARAVEGERPIVRLVRWSIRPGAGGLLRLEARAVAPIARPR